MMPRCILAEDSLELSFDDTKFFIEKHWLSEHFIEAINKKNFDLTSIKDELGIESIGDFERTVQIIWRFQQHGRDVLDSDYAVQVWKAARYMGMDEFFNSVFRLFDQNVYSYTSDCCELVKHLFQINKDEDKVKRLLTKCLASDEFVAYVCETQGFHDVFWTTLSRVVKDSDAGWMVCLRRHFDHKLTIGDTKGPSMDQLLKELYRKLDKMLKTRKRARSESSDN